MEKNTLQAELRQETGTRPSRKLRRTDRVPGVVYRRHEASVPFCVDRHALEVELLHGHRVLSMALDGKELSYLIKDLQYDHLGSDLLHVDLAVVNLDEKVTLKVRVELRGTPQGASEGGVLDQTLNEIEIECLAANIPAEIRASVAKLGVNESLTVADLDLPEGVKATQPGSDIVVSVRVVAEEVAAAEPEEVAPAAPEVITKGKAPEEEPPKE